MVSEQDRWQRCLWGRWHCLETLLMRFWRLTLMTVNDRLTPQHHFDQPTFICHHCQVIIFVIFVSKIKFSVVIQVLHKVVNGKHCLDFWKTSITQSNYFPPPPDLTSRQLQRRIQKQYKDIYADKHKNTYKDTQNDKYKDVLINQTNYLPSQSDLPSTTSSTKSTVNKSITDGMDLFMVGLGHHT